MRKKYICPYCFTEHLINDVEFRCKNRRCPLEPDIVKQKYYGGAASMEQKCFCASADEMKTVGCAVCPTCHEETTRRVCPSCHNTLPTTIDTNSELIISLIGTRDSGKSSYVAVLIHELRKHIAGRFDATLSFMTKDDREQYEQRFGRFIYPKPQEGKESTPSRIPQTKTNLVAGSLVGANRPILCKLCFNKKGLWGTKIAEYTFVFFDAAGEDFDDEDSMFIVSSYIAHSDGIIFLIDPFSNPTVRNSLPENIVKGASTISANSVSTPKEVIDRVADLIREKAHTPRNAKIKIPVAAAFSKLDAFESLLPSGCALTKPSPHINLGCFDKQDGFSIDQEMRGLLAAWDNQDFLDSLAVNYGNSKLFAFSAFGSNPRFDGAISPPLPHRIEDSLVWILNELKVI